MACVYVLKHGEENIFKIGRTTGTISRTIEQLSRGNPYRLTEFARIETKDNVACETFLHQRLRSKRIVQGGGTEFYRVDPGELSDLIRDAEEFVTEFLAAKRQADELSHMEVDEHSIVLKPTQSDLDTYLKLLKVREEHDRLKVQKEFFESKLKLSVGRTCGLEGLVTWKGQWKHSFDVPAFRTAEPDLYAELERRFGSEAYARRFCIQRFG
jgi:hypothetical protein